MSMGAVVEVSSTEGRTCARPGCSGVASTTLSYDYAARVVWLDPVHIEAHPANHDLCDRHAGRLSVPNGWRLDDRRVAPSVITAQAS
jgi:Protein of unknown function (DUF3499)